MEISATSKSLMDAITNFASSDCISAFPNIRIAVKEFCFRQMRGGADESIFDYSPFSIGGLAKLASSLTRFLFSIHRAADTASFFHRPLPI
jgi:hypothetical protein